MRNEAEFQTEIKHGFDLYVANLKTNHNKLYHKPPDNLVFKGTDIRPINPFDCFLVYPPKKFCAAELKFCKPGRSLNQKGGINIRQLFKYGKQYHQIEKLIKVSKCGHKAFCIINVFWGKGPKNRAYAIDAPTIQYLHSQGSVNEDYLQKNCIQIKKKVRDEFGNLHWDLSLILN